MNKRIMKHLSGFFLVVLLLLSLSTVARAQDNSSQVFQQVVKAEGNFAFSGVGPVTINGVPYLVNLSVIRDVASGSTFLVLRIVTIPDGFFNRTVRFASGTIPNSDFVFSPDVSSASLNTTINTSPGNFDNADVGPISGLTLNLTWSAFMVGTVVDDSIIHESIVGSSSTSFSEVFHEHGPHSDCVVNVVVNGTSNGFVFGALDNDRQIDIVQFK